jgi:hypothetical protein
MAVSATLSNHGKYKIATGGINLSTDTIKICLMASGFTFNKDTHAVWSDVSSSELSTGNGYTQNTKTLANKSVAEDDTNDRAEMTCDNPSWTASGGSIGPTPGAILYSDTSSDDAIIGYLDFDGNQTALTGADFLINNIKIRLS